MKELIQIFLKEETASGASRNLIGIATSPRNRDILVRRFLRQSLVARPSLPEIDEAVEQIDKKGKTTKLSAFYDIEIETQKVIPNEIVY